MQLEILGVRGGQHQGWAEAGAGREVWPERGLTRARPRGRNVGVS